MAGDEPVCGEVLDGFVDVDGVPHDYEVGDQVGAEGLVGLILGPSVPDLASVCEKDELA